MSAKNNLLVVLSAIRKHRGLPSTAKYILLLLALHGEECYGDVVRIWPGQGSLAVQAALGERTVRRWLAWLEKNEYLVMDGRISSGQHAHIQQWMIPGARFAPGYKLGDIANPPAPPPTNGHRPPALRKTTLEPPANPATNGQYAPPAAPDVAEVVLVDAERVQTLIDLVTQAANQVPYAQAALPERGPIWLSDLQAAAIHEPEQWGQQVAPYISWLESALALTASHERR